MNQFRLVWQLSRVGLMAVVAVGCARPRSAEQPAPVAPAPAPAPPSAAPSAVAAPSPSGPRAELRGEHYTFVATLRAPATVPGAGSLRVEMRGADGYHVNDLYPVALELDATNATARSPLRRADASEVSQQLAAFDVPVQVASAGASVRGRARFAVCSASNCVPHEQAFAVMLP